MSDNIGYNLESKVEYTWKDDVLSGVTHQVMKKNDEIITETVLEHFKTDFSSLREFLDIKACGGYLYLCCEENYYSLGGQEGAVNEIEIKKSLLEAYDWFLKRLKFADENDSSMIDIENETYSKYKENPVKVGFTFYDEVEEHGMTSATVFFDEQENYECHYEIVVRKIKVF